MRTYKVILNIRAELEEFMEECPSNNQTLRMIYAILNKKKVFGSQTNADYNRQSSDQVIKDSPNSWKHGQ